MLESKKPASRIRLYTASNPKQKLGVLTGVRPFSLHVTSISTGWRNPFRVGQVVGLVPRAAWVARSSAFAGLRRDESQPWAGGRNPVGIGKCAQDEAAPGAGPSIKTRGCI